MQVLVIDDDVALCRSLQIQLESEDHTVECVHVGKEGLAKVKAERPDLVFLDLNLPDCSGLDVLRELQNDESDSLVIMITGVQDAKATIEAIRLGAFDYVRKPLDLDVILVSMEKAARSIKNRLPKPSAGINYVEAPPHEIVGADPKIIDILKKVALLSENRVPVLIMGESGTGKESVARTLHEAACADQPFVAVNCSAVVATLLESEVFGHEKGSFTGAETSRAGKLELAGEGMLFLDEIGDMSFDLQAKLLRVLQEKEFERVGGSKLMQFKGRVVAATNRDLKQMVEQSQFREDLYYRLAVSTIEVPPLRDRRGDIPALVDNVMARLNRELHRDLREIEQKAVNRLQAYDWPGNVRELINVLTRAALLSREHVITDEILVASMGQADYKAQPDQEIKTLRDAEKEHVEKSLLSTGWNIKRTSELLQVSRVTLRKKINDYDLKRPASLG